jgi:hypothetical protein
MRITEGHRQRAIVAVVTLLAVLVAPLAAPPAAHADPLSLPFDDITSSSHRPSIVAIYEEGVTNGCEPGRYCPRDTVTRAQMARFIANALNLPDRQPSFSDVRGTHAGAIGAIEHAGITNGCAPGLFCPWEPVTRAQMAGFINRAFDLPPGDGRSFVDVSERNTFHDDIGRLATAEITLGCNPPTNDRYCPRDAVTRAQMASFIIRSPDR